MPDYKPSQRSGFPQTEKPKEDDFSWFGGCLLVAVGVFGLIFMVYSINMAKHTPLQYNPYFCGGIGVVVFVLGLRVFYTRSKASK